MKRFSAILLTVFVFLVVCGGGDSETTSDSIATLSVTPSATSAMSTPVSSTTSAMILIIDVSISTPTPSGVPSTTSSIAVSPTTKAGPPDNEDTPVIEWIWDNPIITGLSGATVILSLLLLCMCYLWCCKKQKVTVYKIVDINKSDSEEDPPDGEVVSNPWATHNGTATTATEPSTDNELELKATQANSVVVRIIDHDKEMDTAKEQQENQVTVTVDMHEEIPQTDSMTIDWPDELGSLTNLS